MLCLQLLTTDGARSLYYYSRLYMSIKPNLSLAEVTLLDHTQNFSVKCFFQTLFEDDFQGPSKYVFYES